MNLQTELERIYTIKNIKIYSQSVLLEKLYISIHHCFDYEGTMYQNSITFPYSRFKDFVSEGVLLYIFYKELNNLLTSRSPSILFFNTKPEILYTDYKLEVREVSIHLL